MRTMTESEWRALPQWQAVTFDDGSTGYAYYTKGRWPRFTFESVTVVPDQEAAPDA